MGAEWNLWPKNRQQTQPEQRRTVLNHLFAWMRSTNLSPAQEETLDVTNFKTQTKRKAELKTH
eukprot:3185091-Amphidinium_carterae.1